MAHHRLSFLLVASLKLVACMLRALPLSLAYKVGTLGGLAFYLVSAKHRKLARGNLDIAYGDTKTRAEKRRIMLGSYKNAGLNFVDFCRLPLVTEDILFFGYGNGYGYGNENCSDKLGHAVPDMERKSVSRG